MAAGSGLINPTQDSFVRRDAFPKPFPGPPEAPAPHLMPGPYGHITAGTLEGFNPAVHAGPRLRGANPALGSAHSG